MFTFQYKYTFPEDGYLELHRSGSQSGEITAFIYGASSDSVVVVASTSNNAMYTTLNVRKGMRVKIISANPSYHTAFYYAFKD